MLQEDAMCDENNNKKWIPNSTYRLLLLHEDLIRKPSTPPPPPPRGEIFENDNFNTAYSISIKYPLVCNKNIATEKNTGSSNIICTPWILSGKYNLLKGMLYMYIFFPTTGIYSNN